MLGFITKIATGLGGRHFQKTERKRKKDRKKVLGKCLVRDGFYRKKIAQKLSCLSISASRRRKRRKRIPTYNRER